jgi:hypothetical protein
LTSTASTSEARDRRTMSNETTTKNDAEAYGQVIEENVRELEAAIEAYEGRGDADPFGHWLEGDVLEVVVYLAVSDRPTSTARSIVKALVTYGGPTCWITREDASHGVVEIETTWGTDNDTRRVWVPNVARALDELAEAYR